MKLRSQSSLIVLTLITAMSAPAFGDDDPKSNRGVGPIKELKLEEKVDGKRAASGRKVFETKCSACHKLDERYVGPALRGLTQRRSPEWIMNMILNPAEMLQKDAIAQELLGEYLTQMTFQNVSQDETRSLLEYFRESDQKGTKPAQKGSKK